jgi:hypothetical protein
MIAADFFAEFNFLFILLVETASVTALGTDQLELRSI